LILSLLISLIFVGAVNEIAHQLQRDETDRPPQIVTLVIPAGTAERVARGESQPSIPDTLSFVIGDTLEVINQDNVPHELGPIFIPAGARATLTMDAASSYTLGCSFQPSRYLDFDIHPPTTIASRLKAFALATPPTLAFIFLYSFLVFPLRTKPLEDSPQQT
jgi:hypothetical protein